MSAPDPLRAMRDCKNHDLCDDIAKPGVRYEKRPAKTPDGKVASGLYNAWITLNMMTEARSGSIAFNEGTKDDREVDVVLLRQKLAAGESWVGPLHNSIQPKNKGKR